VARKVAVSDKRVSVTVSLPIHLVQDLSTLAESKNLPVSREAERAIRDHLAAVRELAVA
jgi:hypothetical protein